MPDMGHFRRQLQNPPVIEIAIHAAHIGRAAAKAMRP
jgi:hypothetical protein